MLDFLTENWIFALSVFGVLTLFLISVVLLWEAFGGWKKQRAVRQKLEDIKGGGARGPSAEEGGLLREMEEGGVEWLEPLLLRLPHRHDIRHLLDQADSDWSVGTFLLLTAGLAVTMGLTTAVVTTNVIWIAVAAAVGGSLPYLYVRRKRQKRVAAFEEHFPDAIDLLGRSIRAGHAFTTGVQVIAEESPEPVSDEFRQVFEEQKFGLPLRESLLSLADRVDLVDVRMFVTAVMIQRESGGNLAENLDNLSYIIRERFKFQRELRTATAQGRMTGFVLALAPVAAGVGMFLLNPEYMSLLWENELGHYMLATAGVMQIVGFLVIRRIIDIKF